MGFYVSRDEAGNITGRFDNPRPGAGEYLDDANPEFVALVLADAKAAKIDAIEAAYATALMAGMPYGKKMLQVDEASQGKIAAIFARAIAVQQGVPGVSWPQDGFAWRMADDSYMVFSVLDFIAMSQVAVDYCAVKFYERSALKDAAAAAVDLKALGEIEVVFA